MDVIESLAALISEKNSGNKADLKNPEIAVIVEVVKGLCLLSIAPDYFKYRKYNLTELCVVKDETGDAEGAKVEAVEAEEVSGKDDGETEMSQADDNGNGKEEAAPNPDVAKDETPSEIK